MPARHHPPRDLEKLPEAECRIWGLVAPGKGWNHLGCRRRPENARAGADHGSRRQCRPDARFRVIAEERSEELHLRIALAQRRPDRDVSVGVLEIARDRAGSEVHPPAQVRVADESVVRLVGVAEQDRCAQLAVHLAVVADRAAGDLVRADYRLDADGTWARNPGPRKNGCSAPNEDRAAAAVEEYVRLDRGSVLDEDAMRSLRRQTVGFSRALREHVDVDGQLVVQMDQEVPYVIHPDAGDLHALAIGLRELFEPHAPVLEVGDP